jgi:hypothetical protein
VPQLGALPPPPGTVPGQAGSFPAAAGLSGQAYPGQSPSAYPGQSPSAYPGQSPSAYPGAPSAFPGQPPNATDGSDRTFGAPGGRPRGKKVLAIAAVVAAAAVAAGGYIVVRPHLAAKHIAQPTHSPASTGGPTTPAGAASPRPSLASKIDNIATDPKPITRAEIFPATHIAANGLQFVRVAAVVNRNCALSARGTFAAALVAGNCERVVRATYVDSTKRIVVTAGVAALPTKAVAERVNRAKRLKRNVWFTGLDGKPGSGAQMISLTGGYAYGLVEGRYLVFAYATYTNGHTPTGKASLDHLVASVSRSFALLARQPIMARAAGS